MMKLLSDLHGEAEIKEALARVKQSTEDAADGSERLAEAHEKASEEGEKMEISHRAGTPASLRYAPATYPRIDRGEV